MPTNPSVFQPLPESAFLGPYKAFETPPDFSASAQQQAQPLGTKAGYASLGLAFLEGAAKGRIKSYEIQQNQRMQQLAQLNNYVQNIQNSPTLTQEAKDLAENQYHQLLFGEVGSVAGKPEKNPKDQHGHFANIMRNVATAFTGGEMPKGVPDVTGGMAGIHSQIFGPDGKPLPQYHIPTQVNRRLDEIRAATAGAKTQQEFMAKAAPIVPKLRELTQDAGRYLDDMKNSLPMGPQTYEETLIEQGKDEDEKARREEDAAPAGPPAPAPGAGPSGPPAPAPTAPPPAQNPGIPLAHAPRFYAAPLQSMMASIAQEFGVPENLVRAVAQHESSMNPRAVSPAGALGVMQLMPATAKKWGVTDPFNPAQNIAGGVQELKSLLDMYHGDQTKALAAYNAGTKPVARYGGVPPYPATHEFIRRVIGTMSQMPAQQPAQAQAPDLVSGMPRTQLSINQESSPHPLLQYTAGEAPQYPPASSSLVAQQGPPPAGPPTDQSTAASIPGPTPGPPTGGTPPAAMQPDDAAVAEHLSNLKVPVMTPKRAFYNKKLYGPEAAGKDVLIKFKDGSVVPAVEDPKAGDLRKRYADPVSKRYVDMTGYEKVITSKDESVAALRKIDADRAYREINHMAPGTRLSGVQSGDSDKHYQQTMIEGKSAQLTTDSKALNADIYLLSGDRSKLVHLTGLYSTFGLADLEDFIAKRAQIAGLTAADILANGAGLKAYGASLTNIQKMNDFVSGYGNFVKDQMRRALELAESIPELKGMPFMKHTLNVARSQLQSHPTIKAYVGQMEFVKREVATLLSSARANGTNVPYEASRAMDSFMDDSITPEQLANVKKVLDADVDSKKKYMDQQTEDVRQKIKAMMSQTAGGANGTGGQNTPAASPISEKDIDDILKKYPKK